MPSVITAGQGTDSGYAPVMAIDTLNQKLYAVTRNSNNDYKTSLFQCDLEGARPGVLRQDAAAHLATVHGALLFLSAE